MPRLHANISYAASGDLGQKEMEGTPKSAREREKFQATSAKVKGKIWVVKKGKFGVSFINKVTLSFYFFTPEELWGVRGGRENYIFWVKFNDNLSDSILSQGWEDIWSQVTNQSCLQSRNENLCCFIVLPEHLLELKKMPVVNLAYHLQWLIFFSFFLSFLWLSWLTQFSIKIFNED